jgi:hypothetical protein
MTVRSDRPVSQSPVRSLSATSVPRRHARFPVNLPVRCSRVASRIADTWGGRTADVGGGGFAIELPKRLPPGTRVDIEVRTGIGPMRMKAEIVWTRRVAGSAGLVLHGVCLAEHSDLLDLPIGVLLGQWLTSRARREAARPTRAAAHGKKAKSLG